MARPSVNSSTLYGKMEVTIYPYQDVASIDADQILLDIVKPGVLNAQVTTVVNNPNLEINILAGSTFIFRKSEIVGTPPITREFIIKATVIDDIDDAIPSTTLANLNTLSCDSFVILISWEWSEVYSTGIDKYPTFKIIPSDDALLYTDYLAHGDLIVCELLNHLAVKTTGGTGTYAYPIAYQSLSSIETSPTKVIKDYRNTFEYLNNSANQFNVQFGRKAVDAGAGYICVKLSCVSGYGLIRDTAFCIDEYPDGVPVPLTVIPATKSGVAETYQIDILRIIITDDVANTPSLQWTTVTSSTAMTGSWDISNHLTIKQALEVLGTQEIPFVDDGIIVGIAVRNRAGIGAGTVESPNTLWPWQFVKWNPTIPYIGHAPTTTRTSLPVYTDAQIDWS